jgi:hypothetical protein
MVRPLFSSPERPSMFEPWSRPIREDIQMSLLFFMAPDSPDPDAAAAERLAAEVRAKLDLLDAQLHRLREAIARAREGLRRWRATRDGGSARRPRRPRQRGVRAHSPDHPQGDRKIIPRSCPLKKH